VKQQKTSRANWSWGQSGVDFTQMDKEYMKTQIAIWLAAVAAVLAGCATSPFAAAQKAGLKSVQIEKRVDAKQGMRYGADLSGGGLANALASMITDSMGQKGITRMSEVMQKHGIVVSEIVRQRVVKRLEESGQFQLKDGDADGVFVVRILQYGFDNPGLQFAKKVPIIQLRAELSDHNGKRVWSRQTGPTQGISQGIGATWDEYEAQPEKLCADWIRQIDYVVERLFPTK
jgi:hypothetical protein